MSLWRVSDRILHRRVFGCLGVFLWDEEGQVYGGFSSFNKEKRKCDFTQKITGGLFVGLERTSLWGFSSFN